jgi:hypothetical protein
MHARLWTESDWSLWIEPEKFRKEERASDSVKPKAREAHQKNILVSKDGGYHMTFWNSNISSFLFSFLQFLSLLLSLMK